MITTPLDPEPGDLAVRTAPGPDCCTVTVAGDVDARSAPVLADCLLDALEQSADPVVEVDLRAVTFLGSAGLTALVAAHRAASGAGRAVRLCCGDNRVVLRPLEITGLTQVFPLVAS